MPETIIRISGCPFLFWTGAEYQDGRFVETKLGAEKTVRAWFRERTHGCRVERLESTPWSNENYRIHRETR